MKKYYVHPNIAEAETLPAEFYKSETVFEQLKEKVFVKSWHWLGDENNLIPLAQSAHPLVLLDQYLSEPILLIRNVENQVNCFTNVCTHRRNLILHHPSKIRNLTCMYHGRRFDLDGTFKFMPAFEDAKNFPRPCDSLKQFPLDIPHQQYYPFSQLLKNI